MKKIISIANEKGGVGKTTTAFNIAAGLAKVDQKVLLVSLDRQRNLNDYVGYVPDANPTIAEMLYYTVAGMEFDIENCIRRIESESIDYIPSNDMLASVNSVLANDSSSQEVLKRLFQNKYFDKYDYIIMDCKPSLDLFVINAFVSSDFLVIPVQAEKFALDAVSQIYKSFIKIQQTLNPSLSIAGILITMFTRTNMAATVEENLRERYGDLVFKTRISRLVEAAESTAECKSLVNLKNRLGASYMAVVNELLERGRKDD